MSHLSQTLERLIEIISVEKLVGLIEKNTNESPIISPKPNITQPIITQPNISQSNITVKDYSDDIAKIQEQLVAINSSLLSLSEAIKNVVIGNNECKHVANPVTNPVANPDAKVVEEEHIRLNIEEKVCCLPTVADTISEIVDNMNDKEAKEEEEVEDISEAEEEEEEVEEEEEEVEEEEVDLESEEEEEVELESEDISEAKEVEEAKEKEAESEEEAEEEDISEANEEVEEEDISEANEEAEESEEEAKEEDISEANEEEEVFEIEIDDVTYYATSEENGILYAVDKDGEVGKQVGIIKDGEPIFS